MATKQLEKSAATHRERLAKAEAKIAHIKAMEDSRYYRALHRTKTALDNAGAWWSLRMNDCGSDEPGIAVAIKHIEGLMVEELSALRTENEAK